MVRLMRNMCIFLFFTGALLIARAQNLPIEYTFGEKYDDRYKYSNLASISDDGNGGYLLVRPYYGGLILKPKGYFIEHYNNELQLTSEYNYKMQEADLVEAYVRSGQLFLLFLEYDELKGAYQFVVHRSPISQFAFTIEKLLSVPSQQVSDPLDRNYYNRNFTTGFTTTALFNEDKSAFIISTHYKKGDVNKHIIYLYSASLVKQLEYDYSAESEDKNYAFEQIEISPDLANVYIIGKAYFKKQRFGALERKFQYEMIRLSKQGALTQSFDIEGKYSESLKPVLHNDRLICVGFYADRKDNRYNGLSYFDLDPQSLIVNERKYNPFSEQFMSDKYGKEDADHVQDLVFKNVSFTAENDILFNAEEYFVTSSVQANSSGGRVRIDRFHHNDIVSVKLNQEGDMIWARNINKSEVTQGDDAYASYSSYTKGDHTYFFICTAAENPQLLGNDRLIFKQGLSRNRNVFVISLDKQGKISYEKIIDDAEARLPLMVSKPLMDSREGELLFYAKRGSKKQLVQVSIR